MNTITLEGNVGQVKDLRFSADGKAVLSFSVADSAGKDKHTWWYEVQVWEQLAESVQASIKKGDRVIVTGRFEVRPWESQGKSGITYDVKATSVSLSCRWQKVGNVEKFQSDNNNTSTVAPVNEEPF